MSREEWITLNEASSLTGKSINAIRLLIKRLSSGDNRVRAKKIHKDGRQIWVIHRSDIVKALDVDLSPDANQPEAPREALISIEHYENKRSEWEKERDSLMQGMMMYRYRFEELEKQLKLLPAPPEEITVRLEEAENNISSLQNQLGNVVLEKEVHIKLLEEEKKNRKDAESKKSELEIEMMLLEEAEKKLKDEITHAMNDIETIRAEIRMKTEKYGELEAEFEKIKKDKSSLEEEKENLIKEVELLKTEKEKTENLLKTEKDRPWWKKLLGLS
jgi:chromosome segregation ATPase